MAVRADGWTTGRIFDQWNQLLFIRNLD